MFDKLKHELSYMHTLELYTQHIAEQWRFTPLQVRRGEGKERRNARSEAVVITVEVCI